MQDVIMKFYSPCRPHPCSPDHAALVLAYREQAALWEAAAETITGGYLADMSLHVQSSPRPLFRDFMIRYYRERKASNGNEARRSA